MNKKIIAILGDAGHDHDILLGKLNSVVQAKLQGCELQDIAPEKLAIALLACPDILVLSKMNSLPEKDADGHPLVWLSPDWESRLASYVAAGGCLVVWHSGLYGYPGDGKMIELMGGHFFHKPPALLNVTYSTVAGTPMSLGVASFEVLDEHYQVACDPQVVDVFLKSSSAEGESPAGWSRIYGKGRVCYLAAPHPTNKVVPEFDELMALCLQWCAENN